MKHLKFHLLLQMVDESGSELKAITEGSHPDEEGDDVTNDIFVGAKADLEKQSGCLRQN